MVDFYGLIFLRSASVIRLLLIFCIVFLGIADSRAAVPTTTGFCTTVRSCSATKEGACAMEASFSGATNWEIDSSGSSCRVLSGSWYTFSITSKPGVCPANSILRDGVCECNAGYVEEGSQCKPKPEDDPCENLPDVCNGYKGNSTNFQMDGKKVGVSFVCQKPTSAWPAGAELLPGCNKGCMGMVGGFTTAFQSDAGGWITTGTAKYVGSECSPSVINDLNAAEDPDYEPDPVPDLSKEPNPSCTNGFQGQVNGVTVCVPPKGSSGVTELETKDNGDGTKTDSKTDVKCSNGKCEVTKTSTTTNTSTGGTVHSSSVTTTVDKAAFCSQNKTAGACKDEKGDNEDGNGSFTGNCDSGFQCKGDAITCAIAKKQHQDYCEALKSPEHAAYVAAKATTGNVTGDLEGNQTIDLMQRFTSGADDFIGSGSCPPDRRIALLYGELVIPYSQLCPWLAILGNILVIVSCIAGARIIIGRYS